MKEIPNVSFLPPKQNAPHGGATTLTCMENRCACGHQELVLWKNELEKMQDENFRRRLLYCSLHCESYRGLSSCLHVRQPFKGLQTHRHVFSLEQLTSLGAMKSLRRNPISPLWTPQQCPHTLCLNDSDSAFKAGKPLTDSEVKERPR